MADDKDFNMIEKLQGLAEEKRKEDDAKDAGDVENEKTNEEENEATEEEEELVLFDGGIRKKIIRKGTGAKPPMGSKVKVHYTGTLESDGKKFDSSRDRNEPFEFEIGKGSVIKAWDEGVATMKVGERAILTCREDFAYGKTGSPPKIPGGATLVFDIDLLSFGDNEKDVTKDKDGGIMKIVVRKGEGYQNPNDTGVCRVKYTGITKDKVFTTHDPEEEVELNIDTDLKMTEGLNQALQSMNKGEKATFKVRSNYGYGSEGNKELGIGPDEHLVYTIDLISFENEKANWDMDTKEKIGSMEKKKIKGNKYFGVRKYKKACDFYSNALGVFSESDMKKLEEEEKKQINAIQISCHSNTALCKLKAKNFSDCIESCDKVLEINGDHVKALFRRGQAHAYNSNYTKSFKDLKAARKLNSDDKAIEKMFAFVKKKIQQQKKKEQKLYSGMFEKMTLAKGKNAGYPEDEGDSSSSDSTSSSEEDSSDSEDEGAPKEEAAATKDKKEEAAATEDKKEETVSTEDKKEATTTEDKKEEPAATKEKPAADKKEKSAATEDKAAEVEPKKEEVKKESKTEPKKAKKVEKKQTGSKKGKKKVVKKKIVKKKANKNNKSNNPGKKKKVVKKKVKKKGNAGKSNASPSS